MVVNPDIAKGLDLKAGGKTLLRIILFMLTVGLNAALTGCLGWLFGEPTDNGRDKVINASSAAITLRYVLPKYLAGEGEGHWICRHPEWKPSISLTPKSWGGRYQWQAVDKFSIDHEKCEIAYVVDAGYTTSIESAICVETGRLRKDEVPNSIISLEIDTPNRKLSWAGRELLPVFQRRDSENCLFVFK